MRVSQRHNTITRAGNIVTCQGKKRVATNQYNCLQREQVIFSDTKILSSKGPKALASCAPGAMGVLIVSNCASG
jgi:hypothetical protein